MLTLTTLVGKIILTSHGFVIKTKIKLGGGGGGFTKYYSHGAGQQYYNPMQGANHSASKKGMTNEELLQKLITETGTKINGRIDK